MRGWLKGISLRGKINALLFFQAVAIMCAFSLFFSSIVENALRKNAVASSEKVLNSIKMEIDTYVDSVFSTTQELFYDMQNSSMGDEANFEREVSESLVHAARGNKNIAGIWFSGYGLNAQYVSVEQRLTNDNADILAAIREVSGGDPTEPSLWYIVGSNNRTDGIYYCRKFYQPNDNDRHRNTYPLEGELIIRIDEKYFETVCKKYANSQTHIMIRSKNNYFVYSGSVDDTKVWNAVENYLPMLSRKAFNDGKNKLMVLSDSCADNNFRIILYSGFSEIYGEAYLIRTVGILLAVLLLVVVFFCNRYIERELLQPAMTLVDIMSKESPDGLGQEAEHIPQNEFKVIYEAYSKMLSRTRQLIDQNYRTKLISKDAQIKALQAQINPHFLYNTLQSIYWLTQIGSKAEIGRAVSALAGIMDAAGDTERLVTLEEELKVVEQYIYITKLRFENDVMYEQEIAPDALQIQVPGLILQPLLENCVVHGKTNGRELRVKLSAHCRDGILTIRVEDNGKGIERETVRQMNEHFSAANGDWFAEYRNASSIALENINRRLKLVFGEQYGMRIESEIGTGTRITLTVPENTDPMGGQNV